MSASLRMSNTRSSGFPLLGSFAIVMILAPGPPVPVPTIVSFPLLASLMSRSPVAAASSIRPGIESVYVPGGRLIVSAPECAFASWMAARSVHTAGTSAVAQVPSPGDASGWSSVLLTVKVLAEVRVGAATPNKIATTAAAICDRRDTCPPLCRVPAGPAVDDRHSRSVTVSVKHLAGAAQHGRGAAGTWRSTLHSIAPRQAARSHASGHRIGAPRGFALATDVARLADQRGRFSSPGHEAAREG